MSEENLPEESQREFSVSIKITNDNISYTSDFSEPETIFWLEAIKNIILKKAFDQVGIQS
jgi:hypothetical protein